MASVTAGSASYSTSIASAASRAAVKVSATTNATGWPTCRTLPSASTGRGVSCRGVPSRLTSGTMQGTSPRPSARTSSPVATSSTPGMRRAAAASMRLICACATGERSTKACAIRGRIDVVRVAAPPGDKTQILVTPHGLTDTEFHAASTPSDRQPRTARILRSVLAGFHPAAGASKPSSWASILQSLATKFSNPHRRLGSLVRAYGTPGWRRR